MTRNELGPSSILSRDAENVIPVLSAPTLAPHTAAKPTKSTTAKSRLSTGERALKVSRKGLGAMSPSSHAARKTLGPTSSPIRRRPLRRRALGDITNRRQAGGATSGLTAGFPVVGADGASIGAKKVGGGGSGGTATASAISKPISKLDVKSLQDTREAAVRADVRPKADSKLCARGAVRRAVPTDAEGNVLSPEYIAPARPPPPFEPPILDLDLYDGVDGTDGKGKFTKEREMPRRPLGELPFVFTDPPESASPPPLPKSSTVQRYRMGMPPLFEDEDEDEIELATFSVPSTKPDVSKLFANEDDDLSLCL